MARHLLRLYRVRKRMVFWASVLGLSLGAACGDDAGGGSTSSDSGSSEGTASGPATAGPTTAGPTSSAETGTGPTTDPGTSSDSTTSDSDSSGSTGAADFELVVDYATYFGGGAWERIQSVYVDAGGDIFVCGTTKSNDFPVTGGAYDENGDGGTANDGFVARFASDGSLTWATYLNGTDRDDCYGVRADATGVYVTGWTRSDDFPTTPGAYQLARAGDFDIFVSKLSLDGSTLEWSTLIGGGDVDQCRGAMVLDAGAGRIMLSGYTESTDFPGTAGNYQPGYAGGLGDALIVALSDDGSSLLGATYLGGTGPDYGFSGILLDDDGSVVVAGNAGADDFPTTSGVVQEDFGGLVAGGRWPGDAFVARLSGDLTGLVFSTFLGGADNDHAAGQNSLALGPGGEIVVSGNTSSDDFPTTPSAFATDLSGSQDMFVTILSEDGTTLIGSTYVGGTAEPASALYEPSGLGVDAMGRVFLTGWTGVSDYPTTPGAEQGTYAGPQSDAVLTVLASDLGTIDYSTFFGGTNGTSLERARSLWLDDSQSGVVFAGDTYATDFPVTANAYQGTLAGDGEAHLVRFVAP